MFSRVLVASAIAALTAALLTGLFEYRETKPVSGTAPTELHFRNGAPKGPQSAPTTEVRPTWIYPLAAFVGVFGFGAAGIVFGERKRKRPHPHG